MPYSSKANFVEVYSESYSMALNLRQIEAFKALIEHGTVSRAALVINLSQPAVSKLIANLEYDTGLQLFDRVKGLLAPTEHAMQLYEEVDRIFAGVRQIENAFELVRRKAQQQITVGVMPALSGTFITRASTGFLKTHPSVFCSLQSLGSQWIVDRVATRKLDLGLIEPGFTNPYLTLEPLMEHSLVCILPLGHPLAKKSVIKPADLHEVPFVAFNPDTFSGHRVDAVLDAHKARPHKTFVANAGVTVCELVAAGVGVSLAHPLVIGSLEDQLEIRPFEPEILFNFQICRSVDSRNAKLVDAYVQALRETAAQVSESVLNRF